MDTNKARKTALLNYDIMMDEILQVMNFRSAVIHGLLVSNPELDRDEAMAHAAKIFLILARAAFDLKAVILMNCPK